MQRDRCLGGCMSGCVDRMKDGTELTEHMGWDVMGWDGREGDGVGRDWMGRDGIV